MGNSLFLSDVVILLLLLANNTTLLDTSLLTCKVAEIVDTCATYYTILVNLDLVDVW